MLATNKIVALDTRSLRYGGLDYRGLFTQFGDFVEYDGTSPSEVLSRCAGATTVLTNKVKLGADELANLPDCRLVVVLATGVNVVDLVTARARDIAVANVKGYATDSVAQYVMAAMLHPANQLAAHAADVAAGNWSSSWCRQIALTIGLHGKTLGIIGYGDIGQQVGRIATAFGMRILLGKLPGRSYEVPQASGSAEPKRVTLGELAKQSDFVTLHCPLNPGTEKLVNDAFFARMKPGAILINTGRGGLVDEEALARAIRARTIQHAVLDVLSVEPPPADHPLLADDLLTSGRLTITGHYAWTTPEARLRLAREAAENIAAFLRGEKRNRVD